ncbi:MAG: hypothetical protein QOG90_2269 [Actinomycetota bacterium]
MRQSYAMRRVLGIVVAASLVACAHTAAPSRPPAHGALLAYRRLPGVVAGAATYKIRYTSRSRGGGAIVVTGLAIVPHGTKHDRVVLTYAHGTTGLADACAPSAHPSGSEVRAIGLTAVSHGWIVAATDYEGLGTPGRHPYLVGVSEGRSVLDAAVAARQLPQAHAGNRLLIAGYSQGGHAALWANQLAATWAPTLRVLGTFAGAPATEIDRILAAGRTFPIQRFLLAIVGGYAAAYPRAHPSAYLTDEGLALLPTVDTGCLGDIDRVARRVPPDRLVRPEGPTDAEWQALGRANNPGSRKPAGPVLVVHSDQDDVVPVALSALLRDRMCAHGAVVERRVIHAGGHTAAAFPALIAAAEWLTQRAAGTQPAHDDCRARRAT